MRLFGLFEHLIHCSRQAMQVFAIGGREQTMGKGEMTRQEIIRQAAPVFNQRGFAGASMQHIMQATGLEKGGIYRHFTSKQELAEEALRYAVGHAINRRSESLAAVAGAVNKLRAMVRNFAGTPSIVAGGCPLMNTAVDADDTNPALRGLALEGIEAWKHQVASVVKEGIKRGEIVRTAKPGRVANQIVATLEGGLMISRLEGSAAALEDARMCLDSLLDSIATPH